MKTKYTVPAVDHALAIIDFMSRAGRPVSQAEICDAVGLSATTGYRIMRSFLIHNWVRKTPTKGYALSVGLLVTMTNAQKNGFLFDSAQQTLDELSRKTGVTAKLSVRQWNEQVSILRGASPNHSIYINPGARFPIVEGSVGAALLCEEPQEVLDSLLESTKDKIVETKNVELLAQRVAEVKEKGWTLNLQAARGRIVALSMPVKDKQGCVLAAVTLLGLEEDFREENLEQFVEWMRKACRQIAEDN